MRADEAWWIGSQSKSTPGRVRGGARFAGCAYAIGFGVIFGERPAGGDPRLDIRRHPLKTTSDIRLAR
jgi:hypothetical protein